MPTDDPQPLAASPLIGVTCCFKPTREAYEHVVGDKYVDGVVDGAEGVPVLIPALGARLAIDALLDRLDGVLVTGSPSNVDPAHYGGPPPRPDNIADPVRDATTLPLIRRVLARGVPFLAICRGLQELNVALTGSLHQHVEEVPGRDDHRSDKTRPLNERYGPAHDVVFTEGGRLQTMVGDEHVLTVNSLHGQGIERLAPGLVVEARSQDGGIEAVTVEASRSFAVAVQWHPEWRVREIPHHLRLFRAFGEACRARAAERAGHERLGAVA